MNRYKVLAIFLLTTISLFSETKFKFRGYVESTGSGYISLDTTDLNSIKRKFNQGFTILSNQYIKIVPESGMAIVASINQTFLSGIDSESYDDTLLHALDDSYILGIDIERLFFSYRADRLKTSFGIQRLSRGFNFAFTPFDFINTNNVTTSNLPQGKLSLITEYETSNFSNLALYFIPSKNPMEKEIWSSTTGILFKQYGGFVDFQAQYNLLFPEVYDGDYHHLFGIAFKGDFIVGLSSEVTYNLNGSDPELNEECIDLSVGVDYTFDFEKELLVRAEYYLNGSGLDSDNNWDLNLHGQYLFKHYFYGSLAQTVTDDLSISFSGIISPVSDSGLGMFGISYKVSDSSSLSFSANVPMDKTAWDLNDIDIGEYGSVRIGNELQVSLTYKIKY